MNGVFKRNKTWWIAYTYDGKRIRESSKAKNKFLAEKMLNDRLTAILEGKHEIKRAKKVYFEDLVSEYLEGYSRLNKKSYDRDKRTCAKNLIPFFKDTFLYQIDSLILENYKAKRLKDGMSVATINRELALLKHMYTKAIEWGKATDNPVKKIKLFKENNQRIRYLEKGEMNALLNVCPPLLRTILIVALNTGMRQGEIIGLTWDNIDFDKGIISLKDTKNGESRFVPMNSTLITFLEEHKKTCNLDSPYVFCYNNEPLSRFGLVRGLFDKAVKKAGLRDFRFHDLRHTFASHLMMSGADIMTVKELLGHKTLTMTLRYSHLSPNYKKSTVELLSAKFDTKLTQFTNITNEQKVLVPAKTTI